MASYLLGQIHANKEIPKQINANDTEQIASVPFKEAISFLKAKVPLSKKEFDALDKKLRFRAFTMAKLGLATEIETAKQILLGALQNGESYAQSWEQLKDVLQENASFNAGYWETVFRTNTQSAYTAGKLQKYAGTNPVAYQLMVIEDSRTSHICKHLLKESGYGVVLPVTHPFWQKYGFPPYHFNCRTSINPIYKSQIGKKDIVIDNPPLKHFTKFKPQADFGGNPLDKESFWKLSNAMKKSANEFGVMADIVALAHNLGMQSYFPELLRGYETVAENKHGYIRKAKNWKNSEHEMSVAKRLMEDNHQIYLLPKSNDAKSPDMLLDNELADIKECSSLTSIDSQLRKAIHQGCTYAVLDVVAKLTKEEVKKSVKHRLERNENKIKKVFVFLDGSLFKI